MNKIKIIVDSTMDLTKEYLEQHQIEVIPLGVSFKDKNYLDGKNICTEELYDVVKETNTLPKTNAISVGTFITVFQKYILEGYDIFFTGISSKMSSTYQNAVVASKEFDENRILIFDSLNLSTGIGLQVLKAVQMVEKGYSLSQMNEELTKIRPNVRAQFFIEKMDYLYKGGRCSALSYFFGRNFHIKPIIRVTDGKMGVYKKPIGKTVNACNALLDIIKKDLANVDLDCVMITSSIAPASEKYLYEQLSKLVDPSHIMVTHAGCVISSHCGPGTIGILYILKD